MHFKSADNLAWRWFFAERLSPLYLDIQSATWSRGHARWHWYFPIPDVIDLFAQFLA
jgi:hypothetical protein